MKSIPVGILNEFTKEIRLSSKQYDTVTLLEKLIVKYEPDRPCHYRLECIDTGRCPREISCDN